MDPIETLIKPWVKDLEQAFAPYPAFVSSVAEQLALLEKIQSEPPLPVIPEPDSGKSTEEMNAILTRFEQELTSARAVAESATQDLATLKRELQFAQNELIQKQSELKQKEIELGRKESELTEAKSVMEQVPSTATVSRPRKTREKLPEKRVLLVDDAEINRVLISHYFKGLPVRLDFAPTLEQAMQFCGENQYDLLVVDLGLSGAQALAETLKGPAKTAQLLALSPNDFSTQEESQALQAGFHLYLARSLSKDTIIERLTSSLWAS